MEKWMSILDYYPEDDSKFIDPMYVPYEKSRFPIDGEGCYLDINTWKKAGNHNFVNPDHLKMNWQWDYRKIHPQQSCAGGWADGGDGMCTQIRDESHDSSFYTKDQYRVLNQYPYGYTVSPKNGDRFKRVSVVYPDDTYTFKNASINPHTGMAIVYFDPIPNKSTNKYGTLPSRLSYLGI